MRSKKPLVTLLLLAGVSLVLWVAPITVLTARLPLAENALIFAALDPGGSTFTVSYIHSVEKTWVQGIFTVDPDDRLLLLETRMESVGTGLPIEAEECVGREGGWRVAGRQPMVLPELRFRYHRINELRLEYNGKQVPVDDTRENELATLQVEKIRLGTYLLYRLSSLFDA